MEKFLGSVFPEFLHFLYFFLWLQPSCLGNAFFTFTLCMKHHAFLDTYRQTSILLMKHLEGLK